MELKEGARYVKADQALSVTVGDEEIVLAVSEGVYYSLNSTGQHIWKLLDEPVSLPELADRICVEFDVTDDDSEIAVKALIQDLLKIGLVQRAG